MHYGIAETAKTHLALVRYMSVCHHFKTVSSTGYLKRRQWWRWYGQWRRSSNYKCSFWKCSLVLHICRFVLMQLTLPWCHPNGKTTWQFSSGVSVALPFRKPTFIHHHGFSPRSSRVEATKETIQSQWDSTFHIAQECPRFFNKFNMLYYPSRPLSPFLPFF